MTFQKRIFIFFCSEIVGGAGYVVYIPDGQGVISERQSAAPAMLLVGLTNLVPPRYHFDGPSFFKALHWESRDSVLYTYR